ncbi:MAG TPA: hypothetical protein VKB00_04475 [Candidatus Limnocylindrales bacterium]|nr:hypothetical protein [Candidatus Limnocylindrales bacterium]
MAIKEAAGGSLAKAVGQRVAGEQPGRPRAMAGATVAGVAMAVIVYRILRSAEDDD